MYPLPLLRLHGVDRVNFIVLSFVLHCLFTPIAIKRKLIQGGVFSSVLNSPRTFPPVLTLTVIRPQVEHTITCRALHVTSQRLQGKSEELPCRNEGSHFTVYAYRHELTVLHNYKSCISIANHMFTALTNR